MINLSQADSSCWLRKKKKKDLRPETDVTRENERAGERGEEGALRLV